MTRALATAIDSEAEIIGAVLLHPKCVGEAIIRSDEFSHPAHAAIWSAIQELVNDAKPIDAISVMDSLQSIGKADQLRAFNGADYLIELAAKVITVDNIEYHVKRVRSRARRRQWTAAFSEIAASGYNTEKSDDEFFSNAETAILALTGDATEQGPTEIRVILRNTIEQLAARYLKSKDGAAVHGVATGLERLDTMLSGLHVGSLVVVAGRPSMGKSAFGANLMLNASEKNHPSAMWSLEMVATEQAERMLAREAAIDSTLFRTGRLSATQWPKLQRTASDLSIRRMWIDETPALTIGDLRSRARRWRLKNTTPEETPLVVIDYAQLARGNGSNHKRNREQEVAEVSQGMKALAKELRCPVVALAQLNRECERRENKRPMLSDLRETGQLEQDADIIAFLYRDEVYNPSTSDKGIAELIVAKNRMGETGTIKLAWSAPYSRFGNLATCPDDYLPPPSPYETERD